jgi:hypothetical protein
MGKEKIMLRVAKGCLKPADPYSESILRARNYSLNDLIQADLKKLRNPRFNSLTHALGSLIVENIESFDGYDAHGALKRLQLEANAGCYELKAFMNGKWGFCRLPESLSYDSMGEEKYQSVMKKIFAYVAENYWTTETPAEIERMSYEHMRNQ